MATHTLVVTTNDGLSARDIADEVAATVSGGSSFSVDISVATDAEITSTTKE